jgi:hypothetical protein
MDHFAGLNVSSTRESALWIAWALGALRLQASPMRSCEQRRGNGDSQSDLPVRYDGHPWVPRRHYNDVGRNLGPFTRVFGHSQT